MHPKGEVLLHSKHQHIGERAEDVDLKCDFADDIVRLLRLRDHDHHGGASAAVPSTP